MHYSIYLSIGIQEKILIHLYRKIIGYRDDQIR